MKTGLIADYERARRQENLDRAVAAEREAADLRARLAAAQAREARLVGALTEHAVNRSMDDVPCLYECGLCAAEGPTRETVEHAAFCTLRSALTPNGAALAAAIEGVLTGGNHLVAHLGQKHPPHDATDDEALAYYGAGWRYDAWAAWSRVMRLRTAWRGA